MNTDGHGFSIDGGILWTALAERSDDSVMREKPSMLGWFESGVALRLPPQFKMHWMRAAAERKAFLPFRNPCPSVFIRG